MPFQELSKRKRKDVKVEDIQVRVCLFAFDMLYLNGEVSVLGELRLWVRTFADQSCAATIAKEPVGTERALAAAF